MLTGSTPLKGRRLYERGHCWILPTTNVNMKWKVKTTYLVHIMYVLSLPSPSWLWCQIFTLTQPYSTYFQRFKWTVKSIPIHSITMQVRALHLLHNSLNSYSLWYIYFPHSFDHWIHESRHSPRMKFHREVCCIEFMAHKILNHYPPCMYVAILKFPMARLCSALKQTKEKVMSSSALKIFNPGTNRDVYF